MEKFSHLEKTLFFLTNSFSSRGEKSKKIESRPLLQRGVKETNRESAQLFPSRSFLFAKTSSFCNAMRVQTNFRVFLSRQLFPLFFTRSFFWFSATNLILPYVVTVGTVSFTLSFAAFIPFQAFHPRQPSLRKKSSSALFRCKYRSWNT